MIKNKYKETEIEKPHLNSTSFFEMELQGNIHSIETFGTVDGPGIRFVVFAQGCSLRCLYCHNPDTWSKATESKRMTPAELFSEVRKYKNYIKKGGVTFTGGEPLLQAAFVADFFSLCRTEGIHTAIDTSGSILNNQVKRALDFTDLVLLDIKSIDAEQYKFLTGGVLQTTFDFLEYLQENQKPTWVRHVLVPDITDNDKLLLRLAEHLKHYSVVEQVELLPYHKLGLQKYEALGLKYPLEQTASLSKERWLNAKQIFSECGFKTL